MTDFEGLLRLLARADVDFIIAGGLAATVHGSARLTLDVDVVYSRARENVARLVQALRRVHPYLRGAPAGLPFELDERTVLGGCNFTLVTDLGDLDLLGEITGGGGFDDLLPRSVEVSLFGMTCRCLDLPTLIHVKRAAGRPKDLESIAELERLLEEGDER